VYSSASLLGTIMGNMCSRRRESGHGLSDDHNDDEEGPFPEVNHHADEHEHEEDPVSEANHDALVEKFLDDSHISGLSEYEYDGETSPGTPAPGPSPERPGHWMSYSPGNPKRKQPSKVSTEIDWPERSP
jgi:hypothetical protein